MRLRRWEPLLGVLETAFGLGRWAQLCRAAEATATTAFSSPPSGLAHHLVKPHLQHIYGHTGSKWCTRENPAKQKAPNAIAGLHASWVGDKVLAMARPWQAYVEQYRLVDAFKQANIGMILNLQVGAASRELGLEKRLWRTVGNRTFGLCRPGQGGEDPTAADWL